MPNQSIELSTFNDFSSHYRNIDTGEIVKIDMINYYTSTIYVKNVLTKDVRRYSYDYFIEHFIRIPLYILKQEDLPKQTWEDFCELALKDQRPKDILDDITKIITKGPATIVFWNDGTKTVVKRSESERTDYDLEKGLAMAILKKQLGDKYYKRMHKIIMDKWEDHDNK